MLSRSSWRYGLKHPWQLALSLVGIALGVAVVVAIDLAIDNSKRAFRLATDAVSGRATHRIVGVGDSIDEAVYARLRHDHPGVAMAPIVVGTVRTPTESPLTLTVMGVDVFAEAPFRDTAPRLGRGQLTQAVRAFLTQPGAVIMTADTAERLALSEGMAATLLAAGREIRIQLVNVLQPRNPVERESLADLLIADIATAQELLGQLGRLSHIDLILNEAVTLTQASLPAGLVLESAASEFAAAEQMTAAFNLNLTMLSLLALVVGMFLIYNTMSFSVVQRRELLGRLRAVGVTRGEILRLILREATVLAVLGSLLGLLLGIGLAQQLVVLVSQTVSDLYWTAAVREVHLSPLELGKGFATGVVAALVAAAVPAVEATRISPRETLSRSAAESNVGTRVVQAAGVGSGLLAVSVLVVLIPGGSVALGFVALLSVVIGFALLAPWLTVHCLNGARRLCRGRWILGAMAVQGARSGLSRTAVAVAALTVALATTVGVGMMVDSFRQTVMTWLDTTLRADMYLGLPGSDVGLFAPDFVDRVRALPGVEHLSTGWRTTIKGSEGDVALVALSMAPASYGGFELLDGDADTAWSAFDHADGVLISEPYAWRTGLSVGDTLSLHTDRGLSSWPIAAVYRDYGSDRGTLIVSRRTYDRYFDNPDASGIGIYLRKDADPGEVMIGVRELVPPEQSVVLRSNREIKDASIVVFDRTFRVTEILRTLATLVAFFGVLSALMTLELDRSREIGILRALGLTRRELWGLVQLQTGGIGLIAGVLAIPLGVALTLLLVRVINQRSFGWSMSVHFDPALLAQTVALAVAAAFLAGIYPAYKMAATPPAAALRGE